MIARPKTNRERRIWARRVERGYTWRMKNFRRAWKWCYATIERRFMKSRLFWVTMAGYMRAELVTWEK